MLTEVELELSRVKREFTIRAPGKVWFSDMTYIPTDEGWLYLAGVKDHI
ncbi:hypothetical protein W03_14700 [Nitrosomonas sp. PY1]|nr:hypothetical protein W03_14700 [Nitrosomonas sp. PY1]